MLSFRWYDTEDIIDVMPSYMDESWPLIDLDDDDLLTIESDDTDDEDLDLQRPRTESEHFESVALIARLRGYGYVEDH